eukprot:TRINITY_DN28610_c0_g1_i1.p2 TRINITY_DN28610_c0_g1~~TRINITY_DN28610_c0_g1_i1.p2  ORF type:complete len:435 (+),score=168.78 TRINITY_DN28610_c0_g1_i1:73-1377(+)
MSFRPIGMQRTESECTYSVHAAALLQRPPDPSFLSTSSAGGASSFESSPAPVTDGCKKATRVSFGAAVVCSDAAENAVEVVGRLWTQEEVIASLRGGLPLRTRSRVLRTFHNTFKGSDLIAWAGKVGAGQAEAENIANHFVACHVVERCDHPTGFRPRRCDPDEIYRLWDDSRHVLGGVPRERLLNAREPWVGPARPPTEVAEGLAKKLAQMVARTGKSDLASDPCFGRWESMTCELQAVSLEDLPDDPYVVAAFFANVHSILCLHAQARGHQIQKDSAETIGYHISGLVYNAADIEQGVFGSGRFPSADARREFTIRAPCTQTRVALLEPYFCSKMTVFVPERYAEQVLGVCRHVIAATFSPVPGGVMLPHMLKKHRKSVFGGSDDAMLQFAREYGPQSMQELPATTGRSARFSLCFRERKSSTPEIVSAAKA